MQDLVIIQEARKRKTVAGDQNSQGQRKAYASLSREVSNEDERGIECKCRLQIIRHVNGCPFEEIPRPRDQKGHRGRIDPIAPVDLSIGFARHAEERDHSDQQRIFDHRAEDEWRNDRYEYAPERTAQSDPKIEVRELAGLRPARSKGGVTD